MREDFDQIKNVDSGVKTNSFSVESLLAEIKNDRPLMAKLKELGIGEEELLSYLPILVSYQDNQKEIAAEEKAFNGETPTTMQMVLEISDAGKLSFHYEETAFQKEKRRLLENYYLRDFPDAWLTASVKSFKTAREKALKKIISSPLRREILKKWVYLYGEQGGGKSYALAAIANDLARQNKKVAFINANQRFDELKGLAVKEKNKFDEVMKTLESIEYLVIDEFGSEFKSDYVRDQIVLPLLSERSKEHRITFFASDYSLEEIEELYGAKYGGRLIAKKLVSLIRNNLNPEAECHVERGLENMLSR